MKMLGFFKEILIRTENSEAFSFLCTKLISAAEGCQLSIDCINIIARRSAKRWELTGNKKMPDYIKISGRMNFIANDVG